MIGEFIKFGKKNLLTAAISTLILELGFVLLFKSSLGVVKLAICMMAIIAAMFVALFIFSSLENAFYAFALIAPLLPLFGYASLLVNRIKLQFILYVVFYLLFFTSIIKNKILQKLTFKQGQGKSKSGLMLKLLMLFLLINAVLAFSKKTSFMILILGVAPFVIFFFLIKNTEFNIEKEEFIKNIFVCIFAGVALSGLPDFSKYIYANAVNLKLRHIGGPLGSNFLMSYTLITYPFLIVYTKLEKNPVRKKLYMSILVIQTIVICAQRSRGLLAAVIAMFVFLLINIKNIKYYLILMAIVIPCITFNIYQRPDVVEDIKITEKISETTDKNKVDTFVKLQSSNREPIWSAAGGMIKDHPIIGVGNGNFQYFFNIYAISKYNELNITFIDAHNFILTSAAEFGIPFTVVILLYLTYILIKCLINIIRLPKGSKECMMFITLLAAGAAYFVFGNITGASFQSVRANDIVSFTPIFVFSFILFYYHNVLENLTSSK